MQPGQGLAALNDPDPLPPAPLLERYFLQDPIPTVILLLVVAAIGWWWFQRTAKTRAAWMTAAGCIAAAGAVFLLARVVVTEREALVTRCEELVANTLAARADAVAPMLRSDVSVILLGRSNSRTRDSLLKEIAQDQLARYQAEGTGLRWATATLDGRNVARTQCRVQVKLPGSEGWMPTTWLIHWTRENEQAPWQVRTIDGQQLGFMQSTIGF